MYENSGIGVRIQSERVYENPRNPQSVTRTIARSDQELVEMLLKQFELLKASCLNFDSGKDLEVINIASRLRVILEGPGSLIGQLHLSKQLRFLDTSTHRISQGPWVANIGVKLLPGVGAEWRPLLNSWPEDKPMPKPAKFHHWWSQLIMPTSVEDGFDPTPKFSRRRIVLAIANQDGGAHVGNRDAEYDELTRDSFNFEIAWNGPGGTTSFRSIQGNPANQCVRQIGHEVLETISDNLEDALQLRPISGVREVNMYSVHFMN